MPGRLSPALSFFAGASLKTRFSFRVILAVMLIVIALIFVMEFELLLAAVARADFDVRMATVSVGTSTPEKGETLVAFGFVSARIHKTPVAFGIERARSDGHRWPYHCLGSTLILLLL